MKNALDNVVIYSMTLRRKMPSSIQESKGKVVTKREGGRKKFLLMMAMIAENVK